MSQRHQKLLKFSLILFIGVLLVACGGEEEVIPTAVPTIAPPTPEPVADVATDSDVAEAEPEAEPEPEPEPEPTIGPQQLQSATVQIYAQFEERGELRTQWTGSGTIVSADGLILTNAHVAAPLAPGLAALYNDSSFIFGDEPDALVVGMVENVDLPPVETYFAEVVAADGVLDLAVIRITETIDGTAVDAAALDLPFVQLGDSDSLNLGDELQIYGFPGAGGETITFTRGDVSGFEVEEIVGTRAWIKTDTVFSPGNSGGLGANVAGEIVGVPSFVLEAQGGSINRLRSINYAKPLIEAAQAGNRYASPFVEGGSGDQTFEFVTWAEDFDEDTNCAIGPVRSYPSSAPAAVAIFSYSGMTNGEQFVTAWFYEDDFLFDSIFTWEYGESGDCIAFFIHNSGDPIGEGEFSVELYTGGDVEFVGGATVSVGGAGVAGGNNNSDDSSSSTSTDPVSVRGTVVDADSGQPIEGAVVIILNPGTDLDAWFDDPVDSAIYTLAETNEKGVFKLPDTLERGVEYPGVAWIDGYIPNEGFLLFDETAESQIDLVLELSR